MKLPLLLLAALATVQSKVYDVTTIYRLTAGLEDASATNLEDSQKAPCLVDSSTCNDWSTEGWTQTDSGLSGVTFPASDRLPGPRDATLQKAITSKVFDVSVRKVQRGKPVYMVFSTGIDESVSDLLVLYFYDYSGYRVNAFRCLLGQFGNTLLLPDGTQRRCNEFALGGVNRRGDSDSEQYRIRFSSTNLKVQRISDLNILFDISNVNQLKDIKYFRMIAEDDVQHTKAVPVLSLTSMSGSLQSKQLHHHNSAALCVSFSAFVDPRSGGSLTVTAQYDDGQQLPLGRVFAAEDASSRKAESWKFSTLVDPSDRRNFQIDIQADRLANFPVLIANLSRCLEVERIEVHARTTARGLPFLLSNGTFADPDVGVDFQGCNSQWDRCPWKLDDWNLTTSSIAPLDELRFSTTDGNRFTEPFILSNVSGFSVLPFNDNHDDYNSMISIFLLMDESAYAINTDMYVIRLHGGWPRHNSQSAELIKCTQNSYYSYYPFTKSFARYCQHKTKSQKASQYGFQKRTSPLLVSVNVINNRIIVNVDGNEIFDWTDTSSPLQVKNIRFGTNQMSANVSIASPVFAVNGEVASNEAGRTVSAKMMSPAFYTSAKKACVVVDYYTDDNRSIVGVKTEPNVAERTDSIDISDGDDLLQGWRRDTFQVALSGGRGPHFISLEATKPASAKLLVQRIAGCNLQDDEDVLVFANDSSLTIFKPGFDVAAVDRAVSLSGKKCAHGGQVVDGQSDVTECVCPAGFTGENCETGCGANRYGSDCGGRCSATERGCRGMLLCRPLLGCACAPGLRGPLCDQQCRRGTFGANCGQTCGHCSGNSSCDIHTGECLDGCLPGFYPPLCRQKYKTLSTAPVAKLLKGMWNISFSLDTLNGRGNAMFYIVQYRHSDGIWSSMPARPVSPGALEAALPSLVAGRRYQARVILVDRDGGMYQDEDVPFVEFDTTCNVSNNVAKLMSENITETSFTLTWKPLAEIAGECPTTGYELRVKMGWEWQSTHLGSETTAARLGNDGASTRPGGDETEGWRDQLVPGHSYLVQIRVLSASGPGPFTEPQVVRTEDAKPEGRVSNLRTAATDSTQLEIVWSPPSNGRVSKYLLDYQCQLLLACPESSCSDSHGSIETSDLSATLTGLAPLARYKITVTTVPSASTHHATLMTSTLAAAPSVAPVIAALPVVARGNTSLTVRWLPVDSCAKLNGFAAGYAVELWRAPLVAPFAKYDAAIGSESATFSGLDPHTNYTVKVFVVTSSGRNADFPLEFTARTRATTPGPVQGLTVYKRGRRILGLRWAAPRVSYGPLRSFTVTHRSNQSVADTAVTVGATPCVAWPDFFCHTIDKLQADTEYKVTVQARNTEVAEDGEEVTLLAVTKEGMPGVPTAVRLAAASTTELTVQWRLPDLVNGQLRSFLVTVEQTDSANASDCCQDFPMKEIIVKTEEPSYKLQVVGLLPASTYLLSVSAKTVSLGPSASVTGHTRPAAPLMPAPPTIESATFDSIVIGVQSAPQNDLISGQLLLVASNDVESEDSGTVNIFDPWLAAELSSINATTLYLLAEFSNDEVAGELLTVAVGQDAVRGRFGLIQAPLFEDNASYQLVQVTVLDYYGGLSVGYVWSEFFDLETSKT